MPVMINLTSAAHGGTSLQCGTHESCGVNCTCGCPYTGMVEQGRVELITDVEQRYPQEWLGFVIPPGEDEFAPERGMLVVHSTDDNEVWDAISQVTHNQVVHVYYNGTLASYLDWAEQTPAYPAV
ncbi:MAG: hypothetical protein U0074_08005 [Kouleothrix sp.]|jgi:hypothetical protein